MRWKSILCWLAAILTLAAQNEPFFPTPGYFKRHFSNVDSHIELAPAARLKEFMIDGHLELSLRNYLDLVMANNPDILVQKLSLDFNRDAITRAYSVFDPLATASFGATRTEIQTGSLLQGASTLNTLTQPFSLDFQQTLPTSTQYNIAFNDVKSSTNSAFSTFNPQLSSSLNFSIIQPLLRGRGRFITMLPITIAQSRLRAADFGFQDQLIQLLTFAENAYWDVVGAREFLRVQRESLKLAEAALTRADKELELGATSPLEIYQPQATKATAELSVSQAEYQLSQAEDALRRQIGADLDPATRYIPIVLTAGLEPPAEAPRVDPEQAVTTALRTRPDLKNIVQTISTDDLAIRQSNDNLRPSLSLSAQYGTAGLGGIYYPGTNLVNPDLPVVPIPGGLGDALAGVFGLKNPTYGFGLTLQFPVKDRRASADLGDALVQKKIDAYRQRSTEENIRLQVLTALHQLESSREGIRIATIARDLAKKRVDADQKRYELGVITLFFVLASQGDYIGSESNLVNQIINYHRSELTLLQRTGQLLEQRGIVLQ